MRKRKLSNTERSLMFKVTLLNESRLSSKKIEVDGRIFCIDMLKLVNGCFTNISEDPEPRLGAISIAIKTQQGLNSSTLIPDRRGSIFGGMIGEMVAQRTQGIAVTSLHLREEVDSSIMKILLSEVGKLLDQD
jgi:hypothetical protein